MKRLAMAAALGLLLAGPAAAEHYGHKAFGRLADLLGYWEAKSPEGKLVQVWYKLIAKGSVLQETSKFEGESEMVTMYHLDGEDLLATHYCSANNQARMRAVASKDDSEIRFEFWDITNLASKELPHMRALRVKFADKDHFQQRWTYRQDGKDESAPIDFERKPTVGAPAKASAPETKPEGEDHSQHKH